MLCPSFAAAEMPRFQVITADQACPWCDVDRGPFPISTIASSRSTNSITIVAWLQYSARTSASVPGSAASGANGAGASGARASGGRATGRAAVCTKIGVDLNTGIGAGFSARRAGSVTNFAQGPGSLSLHRGTRV